MLSTYCSLSDDILVCLSQTRARKSTYRGDHLKNTRDIVRHTYGFEDSAAPAAQAQNKALYDGLVHQQWNFLFEARFVDYHVD